MLCFLRLPDLRILQATLRVEETSTHITVSGGGGGGGGGALVALGFKYSEHHDTETSRRLVQGDGHEP